MSFGGHVADMIGRLSYNNSLRKSYRSRHNRIKEAFEKELIPHSSEDPGENKISKEEILEIKNKIRKEIIREEKIAFIKTIITILLMTLIAYGIWYFWPFTVK